MPERPTSRFRRAYWWQYDHPEVRPSRRITRYGAARTVLLLVLLAGCGGSNEPELTAPQVIDRSVEATAAEKSFRFRLEVENAPRSVEGLNLTFAEGEIAVPDRMRADIAGTFAGISLESKLIAIGRDEWLENPFGGGFRKIDIGLSPLDFFHPERGVLAVLKNARDVKLSERDGDYVIVGDVPASSVEGLLGVKADERELDVEVVIDKDDFRLLSVAVDGPANDDEPDDVRRVIELTDYGVDVSISPPD